MDHNRNSNHFFAAVAISAALLVAVVVGLALLYPQYPGKISSGAPEASKTHAAWYGAAAPVSADIHKLRLPAQRPLFPYSVIPGGAISATELTRAIEHDPVVAGHYSGFDVAGARVIVLDKESPFYVSYRIGEDVFWSRKTLILHKGETILSDGTHAARTRCGNRLSATPQLPISKQEPALEAFEKAQEEIPPAAETAINLPLVLRPSPSLMPIQNEFVPVGESFVPYSPPIPWEPFIPLQPLQPNPPPPPVPPPPAPPVPEPSAGELLLIGFFALWGIGVAWRRRAGKTP